MTASMTLIGSHAIRHWFPDARKPKDMDMQIQSKELFDGMEKAGITHLDYFYDERLAQWDWDQVATPDELYTMKISHSFWVIGSDDNWNKHASDILFLKSKGAKFIRELYDILLPIWKDMHNKHITNLNQTAGEFFKDGVKRKYDHDSVHASIAYGDHPLYEDILREGSEVMVDNAKFWAMDYETQLLLVREEIMATALERILIPNDLKGSPSRAYHWALRRTATSLFKNEWALFLMLNYDRLARPDCDYVARHKANADKLILLED